MSSCAARIVDGAATAPSPPMVYQRLVQVIGHPRSGSADIARVISEDQGLTGRLLKVVNSAFFAFPNPIESVSQAVTVVGTSQIRDLAVATSVMSMFSGLPRDLVDVESFWHHSLAVGVMARAIAAQRREDNVERFFVAGLLHDIGHLITYAHEGGRAREALDLAQRSGRPLVECERDVLGCDHAQVGNVLLDRWNFPGALRDAVAFHHVPRAATLYPAEAAAVHIAELTAHAMRWGRSGDPRVPPFDATAWSTLGIDAKHLPLLVDEAERQLGAAAHFMGVAA